jgi:hypothetical protein
MVADSRIRGTAIVPKRICREITFCRIEAEMKGPWPWPACHIEITAIAKSEAAKPPGPKRSVAHSRNVKGK